MTADREQLTVDFGFLIASSDEIANTGLSLSQPTLPYLGSAANLAEIDIDSVGPVLAAALVVVMSGSGGNGCNWADYSRLATVRIAAVGTDGHEIGSAKVWEDESPTAGSTQQIPPQSTVVCSFRSGLTTGAANYGRMYLPHTRLNQSVGAPWASTATTDAMAASIDVFLDEVETTINAELTLGTLATFIMTNKTGFASKEVVQVGCGRLNDTQRRRRNQLTEVTSLVAH